MERIEISIFSHSIGALIISSCNQFGSSLKIHLLFEVKIPQVSHPFIMSYDCPCHKNNDEPSKEEQPDNEDKPITWMPDSVWYLCPRDPRGNHNKVA